MDPGAVGGLLAPAVRSVRPPSPFRSEPGAVFGGVTVAGVAAGPIELPYGVAGAYRITANLLALNKQPVGGNPRQ